MSRFVTSRLMPDCVRCGGLSSLPPDNLCVQCKSITTAYANAPRVAPAREATPPRTSAYGLTAPAVAGIVGFDGTGFDLRTGSSS